MAPGKMIVPIIHESNNFVILFDINFVAEILILTFSRDIQHQDR